MQKRPRFSLGDYLGAIGRPTMLRLIVADFLLALGPGATGPLYLFYFHDAKGFTVPDVSLLLIFYVSAGMFGSAVLGRRGGAEAGQAPRLADRLRLSMRSPRAS